MSAMDSWHRQIQMDSTTGTHQNPTGTNTGAGDSWQRQMDQGEGFPGGSNASFEQELEWFLAGLRQHESGDRNVENQSGSSASGYYQYIDGTWNNYQGYARAMDAPFSVQHERAKRDITNYYENYGSWEAAAVMHFTGDPSIASNPDSWGQNPTPNDPGLNPNVREFVNSVMNNMSQASDGRIPTRSSGAGAGADAQQVAGGPAGATGPTGVHSQQYEDAAHFIQENFPTFAWALDDDELGPILEQAADERWSPARIQGALQATDWWQTTSQTARQARILQETDPTEYARQVEEVAATVEQLMRETGYQLSNDQIQEIAEEGLVQGWNPNQIRMAVINNAEQIDVEAVRRGDVGGDIAAAKRGIIQTASDYLLPLSDSTIGRWVDQIVSGESNMEAFEHYAKNMVNAQMPFLKPFLDQGMRPAEALEPYRQVMAQRLEKAPGAVDFTDTKVIDTMRVMDGGEQRLASIPEMQANIRHNFFDEWNRTNQARGVAQDLTSQIATMFGQRA